ncbi:MAG: DNA primase [Chitinophagaceae bacterium]|jgi:DNA primase|nr:DNA primase [Chitinophagaceae bacterium]
MIAQNTIQQILNRINITEVVGDFVKLKKRGSNYLGLCPFHNEKTPSFIVSPAKEIYKCFGCGKSGNSISFIMEHEKYSYVEALKWLGIKYQVEIEEVNVTPEIKQQQQVAESLYAINHFAQKFFTKELFEGEEGREVGLSYLKERGFREEIIEKFQLGYSPEQKDAFAKTAINNQFNTELLVKSGLVVNRYDQLQDNYRNRIIFPIHNQSGKIIGFGARVLKNTDKAPKYINTPENELYIKSKILYGSYFARQAIDKQDECLLVEGYTDVISLHQAGIENVVASGGTSLTADQLRLVKKYSNNLTIIYDGDSAGIKAALRGLDMAMEEGLNVKLVLIPDKEDPDSYLNKFGAAHFKNFIAANKKDFILFQLETALTDAGDDSTKKAVMVNQVAETISKINKAEDFTRQQDYIKQSAQILNIDEAGMHSLVNKFIRERIVKQERLNPQVDEYTREENARKAEDTNYDDHTFSLLFKDELQEREIARVLLEHGSKNWDDDQTIAAYIFSEVDETLVDNEQVKTLLKVYKNFELDEPVDRKQFFIYSSNPILSSLAVSLLNFPFEESEHWQKEFSQATGYNTALFEQNYEAFMKSISPGNEKKLFTFLKMGEDKTNEEVQSAINYLKLRKVKRLLLENQYDMDKNQTSDEHETLYQTHLYLKQAEMELSARLGAVIIK